MWDNRDFAEGNARGDHVFPHRAAGDHDCVRKKRRYGCLPPLPRGGALERRRMLNGDNTPPHSGETHDKDIF